MNTDTTSSVLPSLTAEHLSRHDVQVNNLFSKGWQRIGFNQLLKQARFTKRSGTPVMQMDTFTLRLEAKSVGDKY
ncbi:MAG: hypothetical protein IBX50_02940 [Marinospirillum sp.]|uniref:hypothetical protein n=1 Tax=Marinospirillum sp. TaxID=2183934 RepID=UPI001A02F231|nr:hypothetical protein [Marinospirillum sp.]MBE0505660.1 hypothetical protein [Marinospirillum sp.]